MMLRVIARALGSQCDARPDLIKQVQLLLSAGESALPTAIALMRDARRDAKPFRRSEGRAVQRYIDSLPDSDRDIFFRSRSGEVPSQIARATGLESDVVIHVLAKIHAYIRVNHGGQ